MTAWMRTFPGAITICDHTGIILEMNERALKMFEKDGGAALIGMNLLDCHPEPARSKVVHLLETQQTNIYTIETKGVKKLVHQVPWYQEGEFAGLVEMVLEIPFEMPHFVRR